MLCPASFFHVYKERVLIVFLDHPTTQELSKTSFNLLIFPKDSKAIPTIILSPPAKMQYSFFLPALALFLLQSTTLVSAGARRKLINLCIQRSQG